MFLKEPLTSEEPFVSQKVLFTVRKRWFFKEGLAECFFVDPKSFFYDISTF